MSDLAEQRADLMMCVRDATNRRAALQRQVDHERFTGPRFPEADRLAEHVRAVQHRVPGAAANPNLRRSLERSLGQRIVDDGDLGLEPIEAQGRNAFRLVNYKLLRELEQARVAESAADREFSAFMREHRYRHRG